MPTDQKRMAPGFHSAPTVRTALRRDIHLSRERGSSPACQYRLPTPIRLIGGIMEKKCPGCGQVKPRAEFWRNAANKDGLHVYCKPCHTLRKAKALPLSAERKRSMRAYYETPAGRARALRASAKMRTSGEVFSANWLAKKIAVGVCEVTGVPFDMTRPGRGHHAPLCPSIDRIDPSKGYTEDNVQVVVFAFNAFKGEMSQHDAIALMKSMAKNLSY